MLGRYMFFFCLNKISMSFKNSHSDVIYIFFWGVTYSLKSRCEFDSINLISAFQSSKNKNLLTAT